MKRRTKLLLIGSLGISASVALLFIIPASRQAIAKFAISKGSSSVRRWGVKVRGEAGAAAVKELALLISDDDPRTRLVAVETLAALGDRAGEASEALARAARDKDAEVSRAVSKALQALGKSAVPGLVRVLEDKEARLRQAAIVALFNLGAEAEQARDGIRKALRDDENAIVRKWAASCLGRLPEPAKSMPLLRHALKDRDASVRQSVAGVIKQLIFVPGYLESLKTVPLDEARIAAPVMLGELRKDDVDRQIWAANMLAKMGFPAQNALTDLLKLAKNPESSPALLQASCRAIARIARPVPKGLEGDLLKLFIKTSKAKDVELRRISLRALTIEELDPSGQQRFPVMVKALGDKDPSVQKEATAALALGGRKAAPVLLALFDSKPTKTHSLISVSLALMGPKSLPTLRKGLKSRKEKRRLGAARALAMMGKSAVPTLMESFLSKDEKESKAAFMSLVFLGRPALQPLLALYDRDPSKRQSVLLIIRQMGRVALTASDKLLAELKNNTGLEDDIIQALSAMGLRTPKAIAAILPFTAHEDGLIRSHACDALSRMAGANKAVIAALEKLSASDPLPYVQHAARDALAKIAERALSEGKK